MQWFEKSRYLFTASKDRFLKVWEIPKVWLREEAPNQLPKDSPPLEEMKEEEPEDLESFNTPAIPFDPTTSDPLGTPQTNFEEVKIQPDPVPLPGKVVPERAPRLLQKKKV